jgi:hypothetical protein
LLVGPKVATGGVCGHLIGLTYGRTSLRGFTFGLAELPPWDDEVVTAGWRSVKGVAIQGG